MAIVVPAILEENIEGFQDKVAAILSVPTVSRVHIDFSDGIFTNHKILGINEIGILNPAYYWEAHLLLENPRKHFFDAKLAGFNCVIVPFEAFNGKEELRATAQELREYKISPALGLNPQTPVEECFPFLDLYDHVLALSVDPGYQGQPFQEAVFERINKLREYKKDVKIEADGGVKMDNARRLAHAGAEFLVAGSALFKPLSDESDAPLSMTVTENFAKLASEIQNL